VFFLRIYKGVMSSVWLSMLHALTGWTCVVGFAKVFLHRHVEREMGGGRQMVRTAMLTWPLRAIFSCAPLVGFTLNRCCEPPHTARTS
jgi:hypothetical protein